MQAMLYSLVPDLLTTICTLLPTEDVKNFRLTGKHCASAAYAAEDLALDVPDVLEDWHTAFLDRYRLLKRLDVYVTHAQGHQLTRLLAALPQQPDILSLRVHSFAAGENLISSIELCRPKDTLRITASLLERLPFSTMLPPPALDGMPDVTVSCADIFQDNAFFNSAISCLTISHFTAQMAAPRSTVDLSFMDVFDRTYMPNLKQLKITMMPATSIPLIPQTADLSQLTVLEMRRVGLMEGSIAFLASGAPNLTCLVLQSENKFPSKGFSAKSWPRMTTMHLEASYKSVNVVSPFPGNSSP